MRHSHQASEGRRWRRRWSSRPLLSSKLVPNGRNNRNSVNNGLHASRHEHSLAAMYGQQVRASTNCTAMSCAALRCTASSCALPSFALQDWASLCSLMLWPVLSCCAVPCSAALCCAQCPLKVESEPTLKALAAASHMLVMITGVPCP